MSNHDVAARAARQLQHSIALPIAPLDGGLTDRLAELLLNLAYATRLNYEPTVFDVYRQWAIARYLGVFDLYRSGRRIPAVKLSDAGQAVVENQRRVLSEDLGIGAAVLVAKRWAHVNFPNHDLHLADVDVAIDLGLMAAPEHRRADYLLLAYDAVNRSASALGVLECKGSESRRHALKQIEFGAPQVEQTIINGQSVRGIVSSLHSGRDEVAYYTAEIRPHGAVDAVDVALDGRARDLFGSSWARLADVADEPELYERYAPNTLKSRRSTPMRRRQAEKERYEVGGTAYVGTEARIPLPGGELRYFLGADERIISALQQGDAQSALERKWQLRSQSGDQTIPEPPLNTDHVEASSSDGLALVLQLA